MSWLFSQALAEEYSADTSLAGEQFAQLNVMPTPHKFSRNDKTMEFSSLSRFGLTCAVLTESHGEELLTSYLADFHARHLAKHQEEELLQKACGQKCVESLVKLSQVLSLQKTSLKTLSPSPQPTSLQWVTKPGRFNFPRKTWVLTTYGKDFGYLHTPTTKANYSAESMQKWESARNFTIAFGIPTPQNQSWLMGFPLGWIGTEPLEMHKFQSWLQLHSAFSQITSNKERAA